MPGQGEASMGDFNSEESQEQDRRLVADIRGQEPRVSDAAHRTLVRKYNQALFRLIAKWSLSEASAQDICQLAWLTALKKITDGSYESRPGRGFFSWLAVIGKNQTMTWLRGLRRYENAIDAYQQLEDGCSDRRHAGPEQLTASKEEIQRAFAKLSKTQQRAIHRWSYGLYDAAERARCEINFHKAIKHLRKLIQQKRKDHDDQE
jgi:RNA polymerase sigma factor (sigma-70 family)